MSDNANTVNTPAPTEDEATFTGMMKSKLLVLIIHLHVLAPLICLQKCTPPQSNKTTPWAQKVKRGHRENKHKLKIQTS